MSTVYGGAAYIPPRRVNFGWVSESWRIYGKAVGTWIVAVLVYGLISNLVQGALKAVFPNPSYVPPPSPFGFPHYYDFGVHYGTDSNLTPIGQTISLLFLWAFGALQSASLYRLAVRQVRGEGVGVGDIFGGGPFFGSMLIFDLLLFFSALAGTLALCVGLFVVLGFLLPGYALVADGVSATDAFSRSIAAMKQDWLSAALFVFVYGLLILVSLIPCGLGLFVTIPMLHIVSALAYRDMVGMPQPMPPDYGYGGDAPSGVWPPPPSV